MRHHVRSDERGDCDLESGGGEMIGEKITK